MYIKILAVVFAVIFLSGCATTRQGAKVAELQSRIDYKEADLQNSTFTVITHTGDAQKFIINKETIVKGIGQAGITDIKKGVKLTVSYRKSRGKKIAKFIGIQEQPKVPPKSVTKKKG